MAKWDTLKSSMRKVRGGDGFLWHFNMEVDHPPSRRRIDLINAAVSVYVCSFSRRDNRVAWESYGNHGMGYAIGFDYQILIEPIRRQGFILVPCQYDEEMHSRIIDAFLVRARDIFLRIRSEFAKSNKELWEAESAAAKKVYGLFLQLAPILKCPDWKNDEEWRLVSKPIVGDPSYRKVVRPRESLMSPERSIPYFEFKLSEDNTPLQISEILIGRGLNHQRAEQKVNSILKRNGVEGCAVQRSTVHYRSFDNLPPMFGITMRFLRKTQD
jgi:hypothetical protein